MKPVSAVDVAAYLLERAGGSMTAMKLQKLCYYSQAWTLVWTGKPLFNDEIQAWAKGPVIRSLFDQHRGKYTVASQHLTYGDPSRITTVQRKHIDSVWDAYGKMSPTQLSLLTHAEAPWQMARGGTSEGQRGNATITPASMRDYYTSLASSDQAAHSPSDVNFPAWA